MLSLTGQNFEFATLQDRCMVINIKHWHASYVRVIFLAGQVKMGHFVYQMFLQQKKRITFKWTKILH